MFVVMRWIAVTGALALALPAAAQERYTVGGDDVAIYNLAGVVTLTGGGGGDVVVEVARGGRDSDRLDVQVGEIRGRQTLRVLYPADRISYREREGRGSTTFRVRADGTWGGDGGVFDRGDRVRVTTGGGGLEAHADLRVTVPRGQRVAVHLAVGRITATNVDGRVVLDTHAGRVEALDMSGSLSIDTGSGAVDVAGVEGDLLIDTGSGSVRAANVRGEEIVIDTGSGSVETAGLAARRIVIDTGSGGIRLGGGSARDIRLDTGSGSVDAELVGELDRLVVDTGSGSVAIRLPAELGAQIEIDTGSGGIETDFPVMVTRRGRDQLHGTIGDGRARIVIDTGSGSVRLLKR